MRPTLSSQEPVQKVLLGLPKSVLNQLDEFAQEHTISRPKAIALLLNKMQSPVFQPPPSLSHSPAPQHKKKAAKRRQLIGELRELRDSLQDDLQD